MAPVAEKASQGAERGANSISRWVEANQNLAIALGLGTIAVGGAGVYYYLNGKPTSRSSSGSKDTQDGTSADEKATGSNGAGAGKKRKSKKSKRNKEGGSTADTLPKDPDGPLLDEASDQELMALPAEEIKKLAEDVRMDV
jgi:hypothetical protein